MDFTFKKKESCWMLLFGCSLVENVWLNREQVKRTNVLVLVLSIYLTMRLFLHPSREKREKRETKRAKQISKRKRTTDEKEYLPFFFFFLFFSRPFFVAYLNISGSNHYFFFSLCGCVVETTYTSVVLPFTHILNIQSDFIFNILFFLHLTIIIIIWIYHQIISSNFD